MKFRFREIGIDLFSVEMFKMNRCIVYFYLVVPSREWHNFMVKT
jgi:hypothetical protein